jgi:polyhydroxyalkanoate synthesis regulator phasin
MAQEETKVSLETLKRDLRKVVLAGVGATVLAKEGAAGLAQRWLAKGEGVEPEIRRALKKLVERRKAVAAKAAAARDDAQRQIRLTVSGAARRMPSACGSSSGIPTASSTTPRRSGT